MSCKPMMIGDKVKIVRVGEIFLMLDFDEWYCGTHWKHCTIEKANTGTLKVRFAQLIEIISRYGLVCDEKTINSVEDQLKLVY